MREAISNTAELGAVLGGRRIVDDGVRARMAEVLREVRAGRFADELRDEEASGYARLEARALRQRARPCSKRPSAPRRRQSDQPISRSARAAAGSPTLAARDRRAAACDVPRRRRDSTLTARAPAPRPRAARNRCGHRSAMARLPHVEATPIAELSRKSRQPSVDLCCLARSIASTSIRRASAASPQCPDPHPLFGLEVLVVGEEMLDLLKHDRRQVLPFADVGIIRKGRVDRHADQLLVAAMLVLQVEDADRPRADDAAGNERRARDHQRVERVAVGRQRVRDEAVVRRIAHRRVQDAVDEQRARLLVELVLHRLAADRHFDDDVDAVRRIVADRE